MVVVRRILAVLAACGGAVTAQAGILDPIATCTLTLGASGKIAMSGDGMTMGSQVGTGTPATLTVVGLNLSPKLTFTPLVITGPSGWSGSPTVSMAVDAAVSGRKQAYTTSAFSILPAAVLDILTINAQVVNPSGFKAGSYNGSTTITCESA